MKHSAHYSLSLYQQTLSLGTSPALWFAIEMNDRATGVGVRGDLV